MTRSLLIVLVFLIVAGGTALIAATFGRETIGADTTVVLENEVGCGKFAPSTSGTATNITWYTTNTTSIKATKAAIYTYVSDTDAGAKLAESSETSAAVDSDWRTGTISLAVTASTNYYLCAWSALSTGTNNIHNSDTGGIHLKDSATYGTWPDPLVESANGTRNLSIYVTYTETSTGVRRIVGGGLIE